MPNLPDHRHCTGCMACVDSCNHGALTLAREQGHIYPQVNPSLCVECGACSRHCPQLHPKNWNKREDMKVYGGWCTDLEVRRRAASGGAFSALALSVLQAGGHVAGAALNDDGSVSHRLISSVEELPLLQNSKYIQSDASGNYRAIRKLLREGKQVLFSGTSCQIGGMNSYLGRDFPNLLSVEVVCHGVPADFARDHLLRQTQGKRILSYRDKKGGWNTLQSQRITYESQEGQAISCNQSTDPFYQIFDCALIERDTCCNCIYSSLPRYADITLADFWGIKRFEEAWQDGISLIISSNGKGDHFLNECSNLHLFPSTLEESLRPNPRLVSGRKFHDWHPVLRWRGGMRNALGETTYLKVVTNRMPYKLLWGVFKVMTILSNKLAIRKELAYEKEHRNHNHI